VLYRGQNTPAYRENPRERDTKMDFQQDARAPTTMIWVRERTSDRLLGTQQCTYLFHYIQEFLD
jgi:hypothetical protein